MNTEKHKFRKKLKSSCYKIWKRKISSLTRQKTKKKELLMILNMEDYKRLKNRKRTNPSKSKEPVIESKNNKRPKHQIQAQQRQKREESPQRVNNH